MRRFWGTTRARQICARALDLLTLWIRRIRFARLVRRQGAPISLLLGAGRNPVAGWVNTDTSWRTAFHLDVTGPWPTFEAELIYGDNMVEHLTLEGARRFFRNARAALVPGGKLRLATPDVEAAARTYLDGGQTLERMLERAQRGGALAEHPADVLRAVFAEHGHHQGYCYDYSAIRSELLAAGFSTVERVEVGKSSTPALRGLESRATEIDSLMMLVVEATK